MFQRLKWLVDNYSRVQTVLLFFVPVGFTGAGVSVVRGLAANLSPPWLIFLAACLLFLSASISLLWAFAKTEKPLHVIAVEDALTGPTYCSRMPASGMKFVANLVLTNPSSKNRAVRVVEIHVQKCHPCLAGAIGWVYESLDSMGEPINIAPGQSRDVTLIAENAEFDLGAMRTPVRAQIVIMDQFQRKHAGEVTFARAAGDLT